jgi:hypothetical protein
MAAIFGTHLWFRRFLKARIDPTTVAEIPPEKPKTEKIEEEGPPACRQTSFQPVEIFVAA